MAIVYGRIGEHQVPADLRWDTPRRHQGQIVEVSYAHASYRARQEADIGADYRMVVNLSLAPDHPDRVVYYRRMFAEGRCDLGDDQPQLDELARREQLP